MFKQNKEISQNFEYIINETLEENGIMATDLPRIVKECRFKIHPNGDKTLFHLDKPLVLFKAISFENEGNEIKVIQKYQKLYQSV